MAGGLGFGFGGSSTKSSTTIDPQTRAFQQGNYLGAQQLPGSYMPTSAGQIQSYMNPYTDDVVNQTMADQDRFRQMAVNQTADAATAAGAFGGSRHGVAEALTNTGAIQQAGLLAAQLRQQGYGQALQTAQGENQFGYQYPLQRQQVLTQAVNGLTPNLTQKGSQFGWTASGSTGGGK